MSKRKCLCGCPELTPTDICNHHIWFLVLSSSKRASTHLVPGWIPWHHLQCPPLIMTSRILRISRFLSLQKCASLFRAWGRFSCLLLHISPGQGDNQDLSSSPLSHWHPMESSLLHCHHAERHENLGDFPPFQPSRWGTEHFSYSGQGRLCCNNKPKRFKKINSLLIQKFITSPEYSLQHLSFMRWLIFQMSKSSSRLER